MGIVMVLDFSVIYNQYKELVWKLISKYASNRQDREDLFQEVFLKIHQGLKKFRGEAAPETWIYRIAINTSITHLKKQKRKETFHNVLKLLHVADEVDAPEPKDDSVWKPLAKLNPLQRSILLLADVEEKKLEEIADWLKIPLGTVKSNLHRAREIIKKELGKNGQI
jgi:RNA polymerase sigma-70 factor (ECF subfamily)